MPEHQQTQQSKNPESSPQRKITPSIQTLISSPAAIIQRARIDPKSLTSADVLQLQRTIGNRAVGRLLSEIRNPSMVQQVPVQRQKLEEEETCPSCVQRQEILEEEEPLQGVFENKPEQAACHSCIQKKELEEEEPLQTKRENKTGMPDNLKAGVESLSGIDMSDVRVHYNSSKPAEVGALAYTQGANIHVAPGQERHLSHEAWHVVQQVQGRVRPTMQARVASINDNIVLEDEADVMGGRALQQIPSVNTYAQRRTSTESKGGKIYPVSLPHKENVGIQTHQEQRNLFSGKNLNYLVETKLENVIQRSGAHSINTTVNAIAKFKNMNFSSFVFKKIRDKTPPKRVDGGSHSNNQCFLEGLEYDVDEGDWCSGHITLSPCEEESESFYFDSAHLTLTGGIYNGNWFFNIDDEGATPGLPNKKYRGSHTGNAQDLPQELREEVKTLLDFISLF